MVHTWGPARRPASTPASLPTLTLCSGHLAVPCLSRSSHARLLHLLCSHLALHPVNAIHSERGLLKKAPPQASVTHSHSTAVLVSRSCYDRSPHTWWLTTAPLFPVSSEGQKSEIGFTGLTLGCEQTWSLLGGSEGRIVPLSFSASRGHVSSVACGPHPHLQSTSLQSPLPLSHARPS